MVSLKFILFNLLQARRFPRCIVKTGRHTTSVPYIVPATPNDRVIIGNFCSIAHGTIIIAHQGHIPPKEFRDYRVATYAVAVLKGWDPSYDLPYKDNYVIIGNDVVIGANAIILPGVKIGDGAIIGAGAVVTHDIPAYAVVAGVPAKIIRYRYTSEKIEKLLKIAWWNWSDEKIRENMDYFYGKVDDFIEKFYNESKTL